MRLTCRRAGGQGLNVCAECARTLMMQRRQKDDRKACMLGGKKGWLQYRRDRKTENEMNTYKSTLALLASRRALFTNDPSASHIHKTPKSEENRLLLYSNSVPAFSSQICNDVIKASLLIIRLPANDPFMKTLKQVNLNASFGFYYLNSYWQVLLCLSVVTITVRVPEYYPGSTMQLRKRKGWSLPSLVRHKIVQTNTRQISAN